MVVLRVRAITHLVLGGCSDAFASGSGLTMDPSTAARLSPHPDSCLVMQACSHVDSGLKGPTLLFVAISAAIVGALKVVWNNAPMPHIILFKSRSPLVCMQKKNRNSHSVTMLQLQPNHGPPCTLDPLAVLRFSVPKQAKAC